MGHVRLGWQWFAIVFVRIQEFRRGWDIKRKVLAIKNAKILDPLSPNPGPFPVPTATGRGKEGPLGNQLVFSLVFFFFPFFFCLPPQPLPSTLLFLSPPPSLTIILHNCIDCSLPPISSVDCKLEQFTPSSATNLASLSLSHAAVYSRRTHTSLLVDSLLPSTLLHLSLPSSRCAPRHLHPSPLFFSFCVCASSVYVYERGKVGGFWKKRQKNKKTHFTLKLSLKKTYDDLFCFFPVLLAWPDLDGQLTGPT